MVSAGAVTDASGTSITIANNANITGTSISLADNADTLSIGGTANFNGGAGNISVAEAGTVNFGKLTFNTTGGAVAIYDDSAMILTGFSTGDSLLLDADGSITDDAGTSVVIDNGNASVTGDSINLTDDGTDTFTVNGNANLTADTSSITIGAAGNADFNTLTFSAVTSANISENTGVLLAGSSSAASLVLAAETNGIADDATADLAITNNATFTANGAGTGFITIGDDAVGNADNFGTLTFNSVGAVAISEDSSTEVTGTNTGQSLDLVSAGAVTDASGTSITLTHLSRKPI